MEGKGEMITTPVSLQDLRRKIYAKAKAEPHWRFWGLYVHVCKMETLRAAYALAKANDGAPGSDGVSFEVIEEQGVEGFLEQIRDELIQRTYVPLRARKKEIPKAGSNKTRTLSIPCIRDRVVQGALKLIVEPIFEADFQPGSYGYRPKRSAHQALVRVAAAIAQGKTRVIDIDLKAYFDGVRHDLLLAKVAQRINDDAVLHLLKIMLKANGKQGVPQGGVITPWTQKITSSLSGRLRCAVRIRYLTCAVRSNMFASYGPIYPVRKGSALERCIRSDRPWLQPQRGRRGVDRAVRFIVAPRVPIRAGGAETQASGNSFRADYSHHDQGSWRRRGRASGVRAEERPDDRRDGGAGRLGFPRQGAPAWLIAEGDAKNSTWNMPLTACWQRNWRRSMTSSCPIASAVPAGPLN
jgi:retron-type reverse transcriptase